MSTVEVFKLVDLPYPQSKHVLFTIVQVSTHILDATISKEVSLESFAVEGE